MKLENLKDSKDTEPEKVPDGKANRENLYPKIEGKYMFIVTTKDIKAGEELTAKELNNDSNIDSLVKSKKTKVNINDLLYKVRAEKNKDRKENYMFLGLVIGVLTVTGIIASL